MSLKDPVTPPGFFVVVVKVPLYWLLLVTGA